MNLNGKKKLVRLTDVGRTTGHFKMKHHGSLYCLVFASYYFSAGGLRDQCLVVCGDLYFLLFQETNANFVLI